ncbi:MAG TPA: OmpH family outer membrane protein [Acetobacteraceae bacterium]|nr:OmpH family outer membrane protein [Acetobacteraceae bacterium]
MRIPRFAAALLAVPLFFPRAGLAQMQLAQAAPQQGPGWFIPGQSHPAAAPVPVRPAPPRPAPAPALPSATEAQTIPQLPALPKAPPPPAAVMGVLSVPDVYRQSTAVQQIEKIINARRLALNNDAIKEQAAWRQMQDSLSHDRAKLTPDQIRAREAALQDRITKAQKEFSQRNQQIQEAAQVAIAEVNRMLIAVIREVAESHGMNLVLHREQVALNMNAFDITDEVAKNLNLRLPSVTVPPNSEMPVGSPGAPGDAPPDAGSDMATAPALPLPPSPARAAAKP